MPDYETEQQPPPSESKKGRLLSRLCPKVGSVRIVVVSGQIIHAVYAVKFLLVALGQIIRQFRRFLQLLKTSVHLLALNAQTLHFIRNAAFFLQQCADFLVGILRKLLYNILY